MHLPINIKTLLHSNVVESDRIEFKSGWNPEPILRSICAFANDFQNFGGGYIVVGVEEVDGCPMFPPKGVTKTALDKMQKDLVKICSYIKPIYTLVTSIETYQDKFLFVIWVPGGPARPYSAPRTLGKTKDYNYYFRKGSSSVIAQNAELKELIEISAAMPFDDRVNHKATIEDINLSLIQAFLKKVDSDLLEESRKMPLLELCKRMALVDGGDEFIKPRNIALLCFNDQPETFFPYIQIDVVYFPDGEGGDQIEEEIFKGPIDQQVRDALRYIRNSFITERILKFPDRARAKRFFNYPFAAIEEALANAVYHRSYQIREPIEVRINRDNIRIVSHPGADPSIPLSDIKQGKMINRRYRNRRIGDLFKELDLTEGRGTGVSKIHRALKTNGSPAVIFETDEARVYFATEIRIHPDFLEPEQPSGGHDEAHVSLNDTELKILSFCSKKPMSRHDIADELGHKSRSGHVKQSLQRLIEEGLLDFTIKDKLRSKNQQYKITTQGRSVLQNP